MGNPYASQSASGYDSSPPPDDGSQTTNNEVTWAGIKTKLADPVKNLADSVNTAISNAFAKIFGSDITSLSGDYTIVSADQGKLFNCTATLTLNLTSAASLAKPFAFLVRNSSASGTVTIDPSGAETIDGSATITVGAGSSTIVVTDGTNWNTQGSFSIASLATKATPTLADSIVIADNAASNSGKLASISSVVTALFSPVTNSISGDVTLNNTGSYFDGPSVAQGTSGAFIVFGTVTLQDTAGSADFDVKLWDGTTVIASAQTQTQAASQKISCALSGYIVGPAANLRISVKDVTSTSGLIKQNLSGESKDSTITAIRIA